MIAFVRGQVASVTGSEVVVDVGGVGLSLQCTPGTTAGVQVGTEVSLAASLVVREDSLTLYGFAGSQERVVFEVLQTSSGVGPRLALAMLAIHSPDDLRRAIATEDLAALTQVPGIGKKGAQRIVIELKDRLGAPATQASDNASIPGGQGAMTTDGWRGQVQSALLGLGWAAKDAEAAVEQVAPMVGDGLDGADVPTLLRAALRTLAKS